MRRVVQRSLPDDPRRRRRRAYTTGGLSPLQRHGRLTACSSSEDDRRPPITPQLALRVAILGGVALALFAIVFFRLWFLQVLSGDQYLAQASTNRVRDVVVPAPRGEMIDRNGQRAGREPRRRRGRRLDPPKLPAGRGRARANRAA